MTKLYILSGSNEPKSFDFKDDTITVGRSPDNDIQIVDKYVSRKHLKFEKKEDKFFLYDLKSKNGTFVDGNQIDPGIRFEAEEGHTIVIGMSVICFGELSSDDVMAFLASINPPGEPRPKGMDHPIKRRRTPQRNKDLIDKVSDALFESTDKKEMAERILVHILDLFKRIDRGIIILLDPKTEKISEVIAKSKENTEESNVKYSRKVVNQVIKKGKVVMLLNTQDEKQDLFSDTLKLLNIRSVMCMPLISSSKTIGAIYVDSIRQPFGFRKEDLSLFTTLSNRAAFTLDLLSNNSPQD